MANEIGLSLCINSQNMINLLFLLQNKIMSRLTNLHKNPNHKTAEDSPFILRMRFKTEETPSRVDSINTFKQLHHIYQALEAKLAVYANYEQLKFFRQEPWQERSKYLNLDIIQMSKQLHPSETMAVIGDDQVFDATQTMIDDIEQGDEYTLLGYLAVRCLGDVFGGQHLNEYNERTFAGQTLEGYFYNHVKGQTQAISRFVNQYELSSEQEEQFFEAANRCFEYHVSLFEQMEKARTPVRNYALKPRDDFSFKHAACYTLFGITALATAGLSVYMASEPENTSSLKRFD